MVNFCNTEKWNSIVSQNLKVEMVEFFVTFSALMMESLRSNLVQACDGERITLHCPKNTQILIENVFYGRLVPSDQLCPSSSAQHQHPGTEDTSCDVVQAHAVSFCLFLNLAVQAAKRKCVNVKPLCFTL